MSVVMCDCEGCCGMREHFLSIERAHDEAGARWVRSRVSVRAAECGFCRGWVLVPS